MNRDYREIIQNEIVERCRRNPAYSMRAFARASGVQAPQLSAILKGRKGLSTGSAARVAAALRLSAEECSEFIDLVTATHARKKEAREEACRRLESRSSSPHHQRELDEFQLAAQWSHWAILNLFELVDFESSAAWMSERLGLPFETVELNLALLSRLGFIETSGSRWKLLRRFASPSKTPPRARRNQNQQLLVMASRALDHAPGDETDFSTSIVSVSKTNLSEANQWLKEFRRKFCLDVDRAPEKDAVYCLLTQFFEVTEP